MRTHFVLVRIWKTFLSKTETEREVSYAANLQLQRKRTRNKMFFQLFFANPEVAFNQIKNILPFHRHVTHNQNYFTSTQKFMCSLFAYV